MGALSHANSIFRWSVTSRARTATNSDHSPGLAGSYAGDMRHGFRAAFRPDLEARLGRSLKAARLRAGLTQRVFATGAGVAHAFLAQIESGANVRTYE